MNKRTIIILVLSLVLFIIILCSFVFSNNSQDDVNVYDYYSGEQREDVDSSDMIYIWDEGNMPVEIEYKENDGNYFDDPDFRPFMTVYDVPDGTEVKGAMLVSPGGAFLFPSEIQEGVNVAKEFARLGYVSFVVHYRVDPYTEEESGIDIARAVKYVRSRADEYGFQENHIGLVGFSAGGIANGHAVLEFNEKTNGTAIDNNYQPDKIDRTSSTPNAVIMGYSFYGRLSIADLDEDTFRDVGLPPTYYVYGMEDPFYNQFNAQVDLLQDLNKDIEVRVLDNYPHGFGIGGDWTEGVANWLERVFA